MTDKSHIAFTEAVKAVQERRNSRGFYERYVADGGIRTTVDSELAAFLTEVDTAFLATATPDGQPYAQHRGGPRGFIRAIDAHTIGFADFAGNRQYVTTGNLADNDRAFLFLIDYMRARRVKVWGRARIVEDDPDLLARLMPADYRARPEQALVFAVSAWEVNCPQHIPRKLDAEMVTTAFEKLKARIDALEAENAELKARCAGIAPVAGG